MAKKGLEELLPVLFRDKHRIAILRELMAGPQRSGALVDKLGITQAAAYRKIADLTKQGVIRKREDQKGVVLLELEPKIKRLLESVINEYRREILGEAVPRPAPAMAPPSEPPREEYPFGVLPKPAAPKPGPLRAMVYKVASIVLFLTGTGILAYLAVTSTPIESPTHALGFLVLALPLWLFAFWLYRKSS